MQRNRRGITLPEVILIIAIIAVLFVLLYPAVMAARQQLAQRDKQIDNASIVVSQQQQDVTTVNQENFEEEVLHYNKPILILCYMDDLRPSQVDLIEELKGVNDNRLKVVVIDIVKTPAIRGILDAASGNTDVNNWDKFYNQYLWVGSSRKAFPLLLENSAKDLLWKIKVLTAL